MTLGSLLSVDQIIPEMKSTERWTAIVELIDLLVQKGHIQSSDRDSVLAALRQREETMSTGIGFGIAIPHASSNCVNQVVAAFGRSSIGIEFDSLDNSPVRFIVLFIVPKDQFQVHLRTLALGRGGKRNDAEDARAHALGDCLDRSSLARAVAPFEYHADLEPLVLHPALEPDELAVQLPELPLVVLALQLLGAGVLSRGLRPGAVLAAANPQPGAGSDRRRLPAERKGKVRAARGRGRSAAFLTGTPPWRRGTKSRSTASGSAARASTRRLRSLTIELTAGNCAPRTTPSDSDPPSGGSLSKSNS